MYLYLGPVSIRSASLTWGFLAGDTRWTFYWYRYKAADWLDTDIARWTRDDRCFGDAFPSLRLLWDHLYGHLADIVSV